MSRIQFLAVAIFSLLLSSFVPGSNLIAAEISEPKKISFDDLKFANKNDAPFKRSMLGEKIEALDGQTISIRGWMSPPSFFERKAKSFVLIDDNCRNSFGPGGPLDGDILVEMKLGESAEFTTKRITVEGVFGIREFKVDGKVYAIYHIQATTVKSVPK